MRQAVWWRAVVWGLAASCAAVSCGEPAEGGAGPDAEGGSGAAAAPGQGGEASAAQGGTAMNPTAGAPGGMTEAGAPNAAGAPGCVGLECNVPVCDPGFVTSISGKVFDPSGTLPLYNVSVFIPNAEVPAFAPGASCERCGDLDVPAVASATTATDGSFLLEHVPAGTRVPLVIQVGKWRRQIEIPLVQACLDTPLETEQTRLPRNQDEGDIPLIAIVAGGADEMECLPRRLGIEDAEFTTPTGTGRIHLFSGGLNTAQPPITHFDASLNGGAQLPPATELWASLESLQRYDLVILSCEGNKNEQEKPIVARQAMYDYISSGGRMLASHWHNVWFVDGPQAIASTGSWTDRDNPTEDDAPITATVNQSFPKGAALADWLQGVGASQTKGQLSVGFPRDNVQAVNMDVAREWLAADNPNYPQMPKTVQYLSFTAPVGAPADQACGRAAYTGLHVASYEFAGEKPGFPLSCVDRPLSTQEQALTFMLFELSSCIAPSDVP